jgi:hypothetical protein
MTIPRHARHAKGRIALFLTTWVIGLTVIGFLASSTALALWRDRVTATDRATGLGQIALGVQRAGAAATYAQSASQGASFALDPTDAANTLSTGIAIPFDVLLRADGHVGLTYSLAFGTPTADTVFADSTVAVFPVADAAQCVVGATGAGGSLTNIPGLGTGYATFKTATHHWCLTAQLDPSRLAHYTNIGRVTGTGAGISVEASDTWDVTLLPDPTVEPEIHLTVRPTVIRPGG